MNALIAAMSAVIFVLSVCGSSLAQGTGGVATPIQNSAVIRQIVLDVEHLMRAAPGSDLWPMAWGDDGEQYTSWGDGGGFGGTNDLGRVALGVARVSGSGSDWSGVNIRGGLNPVSHVKPFPGKSNGILCIDGVLYMHVIEQKQWWRAKIGRSTDHGLTWSFNEGPFDPGKWDFAESDGAFSDLTFLTFGQDYRGARDGFVYVYSQDKRRAADGRILDLTDGIAMFRAPKARLMDRQSYEYFAGLDVNNKPLSVKQISRRKPVFESPGRVGWGVRVAYNPGVHRYLLTTFHKMDGSWGIYDAPQPWGPWTTAATFERWIDTTPKFGFTFPGKWMSDDGKTMYMVFSGTKNYDAFNVVKATIALR